MKCSSPISLSKMGGRVVRCGQCYGCRWVKRRDWSVRLMAEKKTSDKTCFLTLTYDDKFMPKNFSLDKKVVQTFLKNLREDMRRRKLPKIRYFFVGEYGEKKGRPHYHAIIFGYDFSDYEKLVSNDRGIRLYEGNVLVKNHWPFGFVSVGEVTIDSCMYVAGYIQKKLNGKKLDEWQKEHPDKIPEFPLVSTGRGEQKGLGYKFYKDNLLPVFRDNVGLEFFEKIHYKNIPVSIPKYFKDKNREYSKFIPKIALKKHDESIKYNREIFQKDLDKAKRTKRDLASLIKARLKQLDLNSQEKSKLYLRDEKI